LSRKQVNQSLEYLFNLDLADLSLCGPHESQADR
jgi:hypothetical protein